MMRQVWCIPVLPLGAIAIVAGVCALTSCKEYRVEHHRRPSFYEKASTQRLADEITLDDGTVVKYRSSLSQSTYGRTGDDRFKPFEIREEKEDGSITLRHALPEHVLLNTLTCLRNEEYELMFEQLLAKQTKDAYEENGGYDGFAAFMRKHRHELVASLNRMVAGLPHEEVKLQKVSGVVTRCKLRPQVAEPYRFKELDVISEAEGLKLLMIR